MKISDIGGFLDYCNQKLPNKKNRKGKKSDFKNQISNLKKKNKRKNKKNNNLKKSSIHHGCYRCAYYFYGWCYHKRKNVAIEKGNKACGSYTRRVYSKRPDDALYYRVPGSYW